MLRYARTFRINFTYILPRRQHWKEEILQKLWKLAAIPITKCLNKSHGNTTLRNLGIMTSGVFLHLVGTAVCHSNQSETTHALCQAVSSGDVQTIKKLLEQGADVNEKHALGWTALHAAALSGNQEIVKLLLDADAEVNARDQYRSAYHTASRTGMRVNDILFMREECFSRRLRPSANFHNFTPLHYAALADNSIAIKILLDAGADPTLKDGSGHLPEDYADTNKEFLKQASLEYPDLKNKRELEERRKYPLEQRFGDVIVGQVGAINAVASAVRRKENGWCDDEHPLVFLFLGSSGIGKTELAKQLAKYLHKDVHKGFIRLDMSEYQEKHEVAKMIGAPPGYIGHQQGGQLTSKLKECPKAVVLFDEVDKAHPDVLTILLQLFDEGRLTDGQGETIECKDAIFVMTSNIAGGHISHHALQLRKMAKEMTKEKHSESIDQNDEKIAIDKNFKENVIYPILKAHFQRDEFLGRISEFVYFLPFSSSELLQLVEKELKIWSARALKNHSITLSWDTDVLHVLAEGYDVHYGARSIKHEVEQKVINQIAAAHERDLLKTNCRIHLTTTDNEDIVLDGPEQHENNKNKSKGDKRARVKIQLIEDGNKNVKEILIDTIGNAVPWFKKGS